MKRNINNRLLSATIATSGVLLPLGLSATETDVAIAKDSVAFGKQERTFMGKQVMASPTDFKTEKPSWWSGVRASGNLQTEFQFSEFDPNLPEQIHFDQPVRNNTYFDFTVSAPYVAVGARFEFMKWPLPGFAKQNLYEGWGVPYFWATGNYKGYQLTVGDYYEQFGSGMILRSYQDRNLGIDGAIRGARIKMNPVNGLYITGLVGKQRYYWHLNPALVWGGDAEWSLDESFPKAFGNNYGLSLGFSYVGIHQGQTEVSPEGDPFHRLNFPENNAAFDGRVKLRLHDFNILAEYATKNNMPNAINNFTYGRGSAELLTVSYSKRGLSAFLQAKRSENMSMITNRMDLDILNNGRIGFMPPFTMTQTYALAAMYPYGTQDNGEWAFQGEVRYLFKRKTPLGGKYGTNVRLSASYISGLDYNNPMHLAKPVMGSNGFGTPFWKIGSLYYADLNFELNKKLTKTFSMTIFYLFQKYNISVIRGEPQPMITANTFVFEGQWKIKPKTQLRFEVQYLTTKQDMGDWIAGVLELSLAPNWMFTLTDTYNLDKTSHNQYKRQNYYKAMVTYNYRANRFTLGYGRTRAGYDCSGGLCREVPSTKGFSLTYSYHF